jgi:hypothetical protein
MPNLFKSLKPKEIVVKKVVKLIFGVKKRGF